MHILVAVDRSPESRNALVNALDIAETAEGRVTAVTAFDPTADEDGEAEERARAILEEVRERSAVHDVEFETALLEGEPIEAIIEHAEANGVDAIYVGHRGLSGGGDDLSRERRGPLGSVAKGIVEGTSIPVSVFDRGL